MFSFVRYQVRLSNVAEADPDVAAAMDILSFALYHENTKVVGKEDANDASALGQKRQRDEDLANTSENFLLQLGTLPEVQV